MDAMKQSSGVRISLRELLVAFGATAVACAALTYPNDWWLCGIAGITMLTFMAAAVIGIVDRGPRQAFAAGCIICIASYAPLFLLSSTEADNKLPTTQLLQPLYRVVRDPIYINMQTGERVPESQLPSNAAISPDAPKAGQQHFGSTSDKYERDRFMLIGHCPWSLLFGYLGGRFAGFVYARRLRDE